MKDAKDEYIVICPKCMCKIKLGTDIKEAKQMSRRLSVIEATIAHFWSQIKDSKGEDTVDITIGQDMIMDVFLKEIGDFISEKTKQKNQ